MERALQHFIGYLSLERGLVRNSTMAYHSDLTDFIARLAKNCPARVIAEGHIHYPEQARKALEAGAFALVVGGAITRPAEITARFTAAIKDLR